MRNVQIPVFALALFCSLLLVGCLEPAPCSSGDLLAPELVEPSDGALVSGPLRTGVVIEAFNVHFAWSYPTGGCTPGAFNIDISEDADFSDISWGFGTRDNLETSRDWPLQEGCFYLRASAISSVDGVAGPYSPTRRFCVVAEDAFPTSTSEFALLGGWAYTDENANGSREADEGGVAGALLTLKTGSCPGGAEITTVETHTSGRYWISPISPGDYCLETSPLQQTLDPASHAISVAAGEILDNVNFRYLLEPLPTDAPTPSSEESNVEGTVLEGATCRAGANTQHDVVAFLNEGQTVLIVGRNEDSNWWLVLDPVTQTECWVWWELITASGNTGGVPYVQSLPLPLPTATPVLGCWVMQPNQQLKCIAPCPPNAQPGGGCKP